MKYLNATPHEIVVRGQDGKTTRIPPSGLVARVSYPRQRIGDAEPCSLGICNFDAIYPEGEVRGIPDPTPGVVYIVSLPCLLASSRTDLIAPDTDRGERDADGKVTAVYGFLERGF
jgi:hypothetical protein